MTDLPSPEGGRVTMSRRARTVRRRRRRVDFRALATGVALVVVVAWTIVFGVGVVLR
jgi:hypothetical protein